MGALLNRRRYMGGGGGSSHLPSGYTQVEYIESNTQPYMTTDYKPRNTDVITVKFVFTAAPTNQNFYVLFGSRDTAVATSKENAWIGINASRQLFVRFGTVNISQTITLSLNTEYTAVIDLVNCSITIAGNSYSFAGSNVEPSRSVSISRMNANNALENGGTARYLAFEVKRNGAQYINYVPAKVTDEAGNKGGFYDTVNQQFLVSANTGYQYTAGPDKSALPYDAEVEYLESDGAAYIDTGIKAAGNLYIKTYLVDFFVNENGGKWSFGGRTSSNGGMFGMYINNNDKYVYFAYQTSSGYTKCNKCTSYPQSCIVEIGNGEIKVGETLHTYRSVTFTSTQNLSLFGLNNGGSQLVWPIKIGATYLTNGTQTLDLIAVRKNGIGYMYDKISGQLIGNSASSGAFTLGPDKT